MSVAAEERRHLDRRQVHRWTYPERRSGFDRRVSHGGRIAQAYRSVLLTYRDRPRTVFLVLVLLTVLNFADLVLTQRALLAGGEEVNPIMRFFFDQHPVWAAVFKASVGMVVAEAIWVYRRHRAALTLSIGATVMMGTLFVYHLVTQRIVPI